jgi:hypothetical protein
LILKRSRTDVPIYAGQLRIPAEFTQDTLSGRLSDNSSLLWQLQQIAQTPHKISRISRRYQFFVLPGANRDGT